MQTGMVKINGRFVTAPEAVSITKKGEVIILPEQGVVEEVHLCKCTHDNILSLLNAGAKIVKDERKFVVNSTEIDYVLIEGDYLIGYKNPVVTDGIHNRTYLGLVKDVNIELLEEDGIEVLEADNYKAA